MENVANNYITSFVGKQWAVNDSEARTSLILDGIPHQINKINLLYEHFQRFGSIVNIQVNMFYDCIDVHYNCF